MASKFAASLIRMGLRPMDVVTIILPNVPEFPIAVLGVIEAGLIASPASALYSVDEICFQISDSNSKCIVTNSALLPKVLEAKNKLQKSIYTICVDNSSEISNVSNIIHFSDLVFQKLDNSFAQRAGQRINLDDTAFLLYSSGTTGLPKGVHHTHRTLSASIEQVSQPELSYIGETSGEHQNVVSGMLPFAHIYSLCVVLLHSLRKGAKVVTIPKFNSETFLKLLEKYKELVLHCVPRVLLFLANHAQVKTKHLENIRSIIIGGAPCGASDIERLLRRIKIPIVKGYGMTESSPLLTLPTLKNTDLKTIGSPVSNTLAKVVDASNKELGAGEVGEMCFKGPQVMKGYYKNPKATRETIDEGGWLHTGDMGYFNKEGTFYIVGRKKDLIKVKGFQVAPAELEALLRNHPLVNEAGVIGVPCPVKGEKPVAFVEPKSGPNKLKPSDIKDYVASHVIAYKWIDEVIIVDSVPRNPSGKIQHRQLAEEYKVLLSKNSHNLSTNS
ncbi:hypothetical protein AAG570_008620 [Ranatra chinensis]|uniref:4-coumarate--CoA ligase n=1 Tax=Ranatra chinensis TaxID=642074 RepID=A0ABD0YRH6_9HEMI